MDPLLKEACEAREELGRMLVVTAEALKQLAAVGNALAAATQRETIATANYVASLERQISGAELN